MEPADVDMMDIGTRCVEFGSINKAQQTSKASECGPQCLLSEFEFARSEGRRLRAFQLREEFAE